MVENIFNKNIKSIRSSKEGDYIKGYFYSFYESKVIQMEHLILYTPQQNGVVERKNRLVKDMATWFVHAKHLPPYLCAEEVNYTFYLQNRVLHNSLVGVTPFESLNGYNPNVSHLRSFGSKSWARIPLDKRKAFQAQSSKCILLGYAEDAKDYKLMEFSSRICFTERSV